MEGKEVRFGIANTALFATVTTDASCGAVNGWHESFTPLGGLVPLANIQLSEVVFGSSANRYPTHGSVKMYLGDDGVGSIFLRRDATSTRRCSG
jgi:hypothetical protein